MSAWYIARVNSLISKIFYYLCLFSMIVPFQMVMFTLTFTADQLNLNTPYTIPIVYLGFGAGLAIFMFIGFVKGLPLEIEEAAAIDGCGPVRTFFNVVLPMLKPTLISVGILELMWVWNDYLLPYLVLDRTKYMTIPIVYLGFGAGLAIFMFIGFVKGLPLEIEEAAAIDGCGPIRTFFNVVLPMMKPTLISVTILEMMWVWNDYLLPYLVLDITEYRTLPIHIQYLKGSYGTVDLGATMALILLSIIPVIIFYLSCQKHIIKGVAAGAVKG